MRYCMMSRNINNNVYKFNVLNAAAQLICHLPKHYYVSPVLKDLHWLPMKYRVIFRITLPVFKVLHGLVPSYLENLIRVKPEGRYHLGSKDQLLVKCKTFGDRAFFTSGPVLWNSCPDNIRQMTNIENFKKRI